MKPCSKALFNWELGLYAKAAIDTWLSKIDWKGNHWYNYWRGSLYFSNGNETLWFLRNSLFGVIHASTS